MEAIEELGQTRKSLQNVEDELHKLPTKTQVCVAIGLLVVAIIGVSIFAVVGDSRDDRQSRQIAEALAAANRVDISAKVESCNTSNNGRAAVQKLLDDAATGGTTLDFEAVEGFSTLLDPGTQEYLRNLREASEAAGPGAFETAAESYRKTNPQVDCAALERELRKELSEVEEKAGG